MCIDIHIHNSDKELYEEDLKAATERGWDMSCTVCVDVCLGYRGVGGGGVADLTQKASRRPGRG